MARKQKRRKIPGHYCWACDRRKPNEKFSGTGHARHLCRECARLGAEELEYRSVLRNLDRCVTWDGFIRRKRRKEIERLLEHPNPRVRALADEIQKGDLAAREEQRKLREEEEVALEEMCRAIDEKLPEKTDFKGWTPQEIPF